MYCLFDKYIYLYKHKKRSWRKAAFFGTFKVFQIKNIQLLTILQVALSNLWILYKQAQDLPNLSQKEFLIQLAEQLAPVEEQQGIIIVLYK